MSDTHELPSLATLEVLELRAGPATDALVTRDVFGEVVSRCGCGCGWKFVPDGGPEACDVDEYSTDFAQLPLLLTKMRERWPLDGNWMLSVPDSYRRPGEQIETSLPLWYSRAALWLAQEEERNG